MRYSMRMVLAIATSFALLFGFGFLALRQSRIAAQDQLITNTMREVGFAISNHASTMQCYPPPSMLSETGEPLTSWRFQIVPFLTQ